MDVLVLWREGEWWPGQVSGSLKPNTRTIVTFPETEEKEVFEADESNRIKPAPYYIQGGPFTTKEVKRAVKAYQMFKLIRDLIQAVPLHGFSVVPLTNGVIYVSGDNKLEQTTAMARLEVTWSLANGFAARALIAKRSRNKEEWGEIIWKRKYLATNPEESKLRELIQELQHEQTVLRGKGN
jgi:hypothetical protein